MIERGADEEVIFKSVFQRRFAVGGRGEKPKRRGKNKGTNGFDDGMLADL